MKTNFGVLALTVGVLAVATGAATGCGDSGGAGGSGGTTSSTTTTSAKTTTGAGMTTTTTTTTTTSTGGGPLTCAAYCTSIMANCTATTDKQYGDQATCEADCAHFPVGTAADQMGDTLGCRTYHAAAAAAAPATHCEHAGPLGGGVCGATECEGFCDIATAECATQWTSLDDCKTQCANFKNDVPYSTNATTGDSLACRMYHLTVATTDTASAQHCPHTQANSAACM